MHFASEVEIATARSVEVVLKHNGKNIKSRAVFLAEGRNSANRDRLGISVTKMDYSQSALAFAVTHDKPHENISTEIHRTGGPFTLVPMQNGNGKFFSSVVWMEDNREAERLCKLSDNDFNTALNARATGVLGRLKCLTPKQSFLIILLTCIYRT